MKILFVGTSPSPGLESMLVSGGFTTETLRNLSSNPSAEMVIIAVSKASQLDECLKWKKKNPKCWTALLVEKASLKEQEFQHRLLAFDSKNAVWLEETWESLFWFSLQGYFENLKQEKKLEEFEQNYSALSKQLTQLEEGTNKLLAHFERDVDQAENIQRTLLSPQSPEITGVQMAVKYLPSPGLGGDYYDIFEFGDKKRYGILLADSKTHGMAAALLSVLLKLKVEEMRHRFPDTNQLISYLNQELKRAFPKEPQPLQVFYGILDRTDLTLRYTSAGELKPLIFRQGKMKVFPSPQSPTLGMMDHFDYREERIQLEPGDLILLHTDGLEAVLSKQAGTPYESLESIFKKTNLDTLSIQNNLLAKIHEATESDGLPDDITLIQLLIEERTLYLAQSR